MQVKEKRQKSMVNKSDIIQTITAGGHWRHIEVRKGEAALAVDLILDFLTDRLADGQRIALRGFGTFFVTKRLARQARNPRTGEPVDTPPRRVPRFRAGRDLLIAANSPPPPHSSRQNLS